MQKLGPDVSVVKSNINQICSTNNTFWSQAENVHTEIRLQLEVPRCFLRVNGFPVELEAELFVRNTLFMAVEPH